jgi:hypothetical protein
VEVGAVPARAGRVDGAVVAATVRAFTAVVLVAPAAVVVVVVASVVDVVVELVVLLLVVLLGTEEATDRVVEVVDVAAVSLDESLWLLTAIAMPAAASRAITTRIVTMRAVRPPPEP